MRVWVFSVSVGLAGLAAASPTTFIEGNVRVQFLSPTLVRLEVKGPKGFEDRKTFTVVERNWPGAKVTKALPIGQAMFQSERLHVTVPRDAVSLVGVKVEAIAEKKGPYAYMGGTLFEGTEKLPANAYFPPPGKKSGYVVADNPRLIPSPWGATPAPEGNTLFPETSGWDTGNNAPDVYVFGNPDYKKMRQEFLRLTGYTELPPLYAFGFIDSRWERYSEKTALASIDEYRKRKIPLDMFVCDTDWRANGSFGYDIAKNYFPDMQRFIQEAHKRNVRLMFNDHPNPITDALSAEELGTRWNGLTSLLKLGMDVWWYDRNWSTHLKEPMSGIRPEVWGQALYHDITQRQRPGQRPLIMTNVQGIDNGFWNYPPHPASHRYPVQWTGDTLGTWDFMDRAVRNGVRAGVERLHAYVNDDLGGHATNPTPELYIRFLQYGCLGPITRVHCTLGQQRMPWSFGPDAERIVPEYIKLRYRLLPTIYSAARRNYEDGTPILQRCDLLWPSFKEANDDTQFVLGDDILVAPILKSMMPQPAPISESLVPYGFKAEYFDNRNLEGEPKVSTLVKQVFFDWGEGSPSKDIPNDRFSARWIGEIGPVAETGDYDFLVNTDDGARLWLDGKLLIDAWKPNDSVVYDKRIHLEKGSTHELKLEYYEETGGAKCQLGFVKVPKVDVKESKRSVWIPPGEWQDLWTGDRVVGPKVIQTKAPLEKMPMWVRCGGLVFTGPDLQYTGEKPLDPVTVNVAIPTQDGSWTRTLYQDDGQTNGYKSGQFVKTDVRLTKKGKKVTLEILPSQGPMLAKAPKRWRFQIVSGAAKRMPFEPTGVKEVNRPNVRKIVKAAMTGPK